MFFIFGWGRQTIGKHGPVYKYHCDNCSNDEYWQLYSRRTWFTLFFIPVIPYSTEYLLLCPICNYGIQIDARKFNELKMVAQCNLDLIEQRITPEEHSKRIKQISAPLSGPVSSEEADLEGKTETQKNYIRQMREIEKEKSSKGELAEKTQE